VQRLAANVGDRVERGQVIAELERVEYDAVVALREAELRQAESVLAAAQVFDPQSVARAEAELRQAEATATLAAQAWERYQQLLRIQGVAQAEADVVLERYRVAQGGLEAARNSLDLARSGGTEQRRQAEASLDRARAELESALVERSFTSIRAPISGVVASVATQEGETVAAGLSAPTFLTIVDLERLHVEAYVDEVDIGKVKPGLPVTVSVDAFPALDFEGRVAAVYPNAVIQDNVVRYVTAVAIEGPYSDHLRPEMTASVRISL
jgi:multidrug resistance efflux pump